MNHQHVLLYFKVGHYGIIYEGLFQHYYIKNGRGIIFYFKVVYNCRLFSRGFDYLCSKTTHTFQLSDSNMYYVNHMSAYEHGIMKQHGFAKAENQTRTLSQRAVLSQCTNLTISNSTNVISLVPFYGGRPPDVDKALKVQSIGQGNSLVGASIKAMQCMATVCSALKHFGGRAVIGITNDQDRRVLTNTVRSVISYCQS